jgi:hypothetical protein
MMRGDQNADFGASANPLPDVGNGSHAHLLGQFAKPPVPFRPSRSFRAQCRRIVRRRPSRGPTYLKALSWAAAAGVASATPNARLPLPCRNTEYRAMTKSVVHRLAKSSARQANEALLLSRGLAARTPRSDSLRWLTPSRWSRRQFCSGPRAKHCQRDVCVGLGDSSVPPSEHCKLDPRLIADR